MQTKEMLPEIEVVVTDFRQLQYLK